MQNKNILRAVILCIFTGLLPASFLAVRNDERVQRPCEPLGYARDRLREAIQTVISARLVEKYKQLVMTTDTPRPCEVRSNPEKKNVQNYTVRSI
jgi:hypothetical protein